MNSPPPTTDRLAGLTWLRLPDVDSTNLEAERRIRSESAPPEALEEGFVVTADVQTGGEGRRGASWQSPEGGLWLSLAWPIPDPPEPFLTGLGLRLGVACLRTVRHALEGGADPATPELRWPNDVLVGGRKLCGCMARVAPAAGRTWAVLGVGMNVRNRAVPLRDVRTPAVSLGELGAPDPDPIRVARALVERLARAMPAHGVPPDVLADAAGALHGLGEPARLVSEGVVVEGVLAGLAPDGGPIVLTPGGEVALPPSAETVHG